jgi:hypothetical protein
MGKENRYRAKPARMGTHEHTSSVDGSHLQGPKTPLRSFAQSLSVRTGSDARSHASQRGRKHTGDRVWHGKKSQSLDTVIASRSLGRPLSFSSSNLRPLSSSGVHRGLLPAKDRWLLRDRRYRFPLKQRARNDRRAATLQQPCLGTAVTPLAVTAQEPASPTVVGGGPRDLWTESGSLNH